MKAFSNFSVLDVYLGTMHFNPWEKHHFFAFIQISESPEAAIFFSYEGGRWEFAGIFLDKRERIPGANDLNPRIEFAYSFCRLGYTFR